MNHQTKFSNQTSFAHTYYGILGLNPTATYEEIRQAYRKLSKLYHPDTTNFSPLQAKRKFQQLNEAYVILSNPQKRSLYDLKIGYSRQNVAYTTNNLDHFQDDKNKDDRHSNSAYLDPHDRPLSAGEIFALLMMGITLLGCLILAITIAWLRQ